VRWESGREATDFGFTGQRDEATFALIDYNARYYNPQLGMFASLDTIVPDPAKGNDHNCYLYTRGNPLKYTDPCGYDPQHPGDPDPNDAACGTD
jgi:RHS repeat-associated protein